MGFGFELVLMARGSFSSSFMHETMLTVKAKMKKQIIKYLIFIEEVYIDDLGNTMAV